MLDSAVGLEQLESHAQENNILPFQSALALKSPLIAKAHLWPEPLDISEGSRRQKIALLTDDDTTLLAQFTRAICAQIHFPESTAYLHGLSCVASACCKAFTYDFYGEKKPVNLYTIGSQPPSSGKSGVNEFFTNPIAEAYQAINEASASRRRKLKIEVKNLTKKLESGKLKDFEEMEVFDKLESAENELDSLPEWIPFLDDITIEAAEQVAAEQQGMINICSAEADAVNIITGGAYGESGKKPNVGLILKGWDGEFLGSKRITRSGINRNVRVSFAVIAQDDGIDSVFSSTQGRGLAERFLLCAEPNLFGTRNRGKKIMVPKALKTQYKNLVRNIVSEQAITLKFTDNALNMVNAYAQAFEPHLADGGKYSHDLLTGVTGKIDKQIIKIACVLHVCDHWQDGADRSITVTDDYVTKAHYVFNESLKTYIAIADNLGVAGGKSELIYLVDYITKQAEKGRKKITLQTMRDNVKSGKPFRGVRNLTAQLKDVLIPALEDAFYVAYDGSVIHINPRLK